MPFCHKCGAKLEDGDKFCVKCGATVKESKSALTDKEKKEISIPEKNEIKKESESVVVQKANTFTDKVVKPEKARRKFITPITVSVILILLAASVATVIGIFCFNMDKEETLSAEEIEQMELVDEKLGRLRKDDGYIRKSADEKYEEMMSAIKEEAAAGRIKKNSIIYDKDNKVITYEYSNGVWGAETLDYKRSSFLSGPGYVNPISSFNDHPDDIMSVTQNSTGKKADAIILNATTAHEERRWTKDWADRFDKEWERFGVETKIKYNVTLDDLMHLDGYEFIMIEAHGGYLSYNTFGIPHFHPYFKLEQEYNDYLDEKYSADLKKHRIIKTSGVYAVSGSFITAHNEDLSDSILFLLSCSILGNDKSLDKTWEKQLDAGNGKKGVSSFVAFQYEVLSEYGWEFAYVYGNSLIKGKTSGEAYNEAMSEIGDHTAWCDSEQANAWAKQYNLVSQYEVKKEHFKTKPVKAHVLGNKKAKFKWEDAGNDSPLISETTTDTKPSEVETSASETTVNDTSAPSETTETSETTAAASKKTVKVTNRYYKTRTFKNDGTTKKITCSVPKISISGVDTSAVNEKIYKNLKSSVTAFKIAKKGAGSVKYARYEYYIGNGYVSIITWADVQDLEGSGPYFYKHYVFNIDTSDGHIMTKKEFLSKFDMSEKDFTNAVKNKTSVKYNPNSQMPRSEYHEKVNNTEAPKNAVPYINKSGELCYATKIWVPGGPQAHDAEGVLVPKKKLSKAKVSTVNEPWRKAYIEFLATDEDVRSYEQDGICTEYTLIYLDDDNIPEIFVNTGTSAGGEYILTYHNGNIVKQYFPRTGSEYIERSGLVYTNTGHMWYYPLTITKLENGVFKVIGKGLSYVSEEDLKKMEKDENSDLILTYEWEGKTVTKDQFNAKVAELYNLKKSKVPNNYYTYDKFINLLKTGK